MQAQIEEEAISEVRRVEGIKRRLDREEAMQRLIEQDPRSQIVRDLLSKIQEYPLLQAHIQAISQPHTIQQLKRDLDLVSDQIRHIQSNPQFQAAQAALSPLDPQFQAAQEALLQSQAALLQKDPQFQAALSRIRQVLLGESDTQP